MLQGVVAIGVAAGAVMAAKRVTLRKSVNVIPMGIAMGFIVLVMNFVTSFWIAVPLLILIGYLSGYFVVPMNALLQHRGFVLLSAGRSIAIQGFNENASILVMLGVYATCTRFEVPIVPLIGAFGLFISLAMGFLWWMSAKHKTQHSP